MKLLAIDTSTHRTSLALGVEGHSPALLDGEGGAQASASLLPGIQRLLLEQGLALADLDALVFGHGPGAFTGLRTATAVVQGLAYGVRSPRHPHGLPVLPVDTLLAVAENAREATHPTSAPPSGRPLWVVATLDARMGEVYAAVYRFADAAQPQATRVAGPWLMQPTQLPAQLATVAGLPLDGAAPLLLAGNALTLLSPLPPPLASAVPIEAWPTASALLRLAPAAWAQGAAVPAAQAQPLYVRDKVAQTTAERQAANPPPSTAGAPA